MSSVHCWLSVCRHSMAWISTIPGRCRKASGVLVVSKPHLVPQILNHPLLLAAGVGLAGLVAKHVLEHHRQNPYGYNQGGYQQNQFVQQELAQEQQRDQHLQYELQREERQIERLEDREQRHHRREDYF